MGCVETTNDPKIIRLTYQDQKARIKRVEADVIKEFDTNPCLRSSTAIKGLFHKGVIVTEGHGDRVFYDEINHRLRKINKDLDDILFIDSGGINSINNFVTPLRKIGVPAAAIVDLDIITAENNAQWKKLLDECGVIEDLDTKRIACLQEGKFKKGGISALNGIVKSTAIELLDTLACYGIFVVPVGELEYWIPKSESDYTPKFKKGPKWKNNWISEIGNPTNEDFDASWWGFNKWSFINEMSKWIHNPNRKGIPASTLYKI